MSMEIYACLYVGEFPVQSMLRLRPELCEKPCVVVEGDPPLQHICSLNTKARLLGIKPGMTRAELDTFPASVVLARSGQAETTAQAMLRECAAIFSPRIEDCSAEPALILGMDIMGTERLFGPPEILARNLLESVHSAGISARVIISSNFNAAICLAKGISSGRNIQVIERGDEANALSSLPLNILNLTEQQAETLAVWGVRTLGMLATLPDKELVARIGQDGKRLRKLARGESEHLFQPSAPVITLEERMEFDSPIELLNSLLFVVGIMLDSLIAKTKARVLALASVTITLLLEGGGSYPRTIRPASPSMEKQFWIKLLYLDLEAHPPRKAIAGIALHAEAGKPNEVQAGLFSPPLPEPACLDVTLAQLRKILGGKNVGCAVLEDSHASDCFRMEPFRLSSGNTDPGISRPQIALRMLRPPETIAVILENSRPIAFYFRNQRYAVECAYGPWISDSGWWTETQWAFEQWDLVARVQDAPVLCCCMMQDLTQRQWQMVALYD